MNKYQLMSTLALVATTGVSYAAAPTSPPQTVYRTLTKLGQPKQLQATVPAVPHVVSDEEIRAMNDSDFKRAVDSVRATSPGDNSARDDEWATPSQF